MAEEYSNRVAIGGNKWWDSSSTTPTTSSVVVFPHNQSLHMMGLGLSSYPTQGHNIVNGGFRSMLQDGILYAAGEKPFLADEATPERIKPIKGTFSADQYSHASSVDNCSHGGQLASPTESGIFHALMEPPPMQSWYGYNQAAGYGNSDNLMPNCNWSTNTTSSNKIQHEAPQFLKASNQQPNFINNNICSQGGSAFWNTAAELRQAAFFPVLQPQPLAVPTFHDKHHHHKNNMMAVRSTSGAARKSNSGSNRTSTATTTSTGGATAKQSRNEDSPTLPPFKVKKEKMGDRITALQQLVSPFGKTDTASVLSEVIEYIKFLHEQVNVLSTPYLKSGASLQQQQQIYDKFKDPETPKKDLRSRGLCLVPVSSTFPVAHETTVDFWTPAFGSGAFR